MIPLYAYNMRLPLVTLSLIAINIVIYIYTLTLNDTQLTSFYTTYGIDRFRGIDLGYRHITYGFIHMGIVHIAGNIWILWLVGSVVEYQKSRIHYIILLAVGIVATAIIFINRYGDNNTILLGMSGGIALLIGYATIACNNIIRTYIFPIYVVNIKARILFILWALIQLVLIQLPMFSDTAVICHISGFIIGATIGSIEEIARRL